MPAFAFTVGSLGDFIALADLVVKIGVALYKPGECTKGLQDLKRELEQNGSPRGPEEDAQSGKLPEDDSDSSRSDQTGHERVLG
jgi:hypothetical protein